MSDTVTLSRELAERIRRMCVPIKAEVATYNEFEAALAAPQPTINDDLTVAQPVKQASPQIEVGPKLFSFRSRVDWSNKASKKWKAHGLTAQKTLCIDQKGRVCGWGEHFITAEDESAYPIDVYLLRADMAPEIEGAKP